MVGVLGAFAACRASSWAARSAKLTAANASGKTAVPGIWTPPLEFANCPSKWPPAVIGEERQPGPRQSATATSSLTPDQ